MTPPAVRIERLEVVAGGRRILAVPELSIQPGEVLAILGPNGAGKSTLVRTCVGLCRPSAGSVTVLAEPIHRLSRRALTLTRRRIGYVPQELAAHSFMPLTLREVVAIGRTGVAGLLRPLRHNDWHIIDTWIERLGLGPLAQQSYASLSGGEQRKALIARAMVQEPQLLVLDEPTAFLDLGWREHIVRTLDQLYTEAKPTMILVCHELEVLPTCCRRLVLLDRGEILAQGAPDDVLTNERVRSLYGDGLRVVHAAGRHAVIPGGEGRT